MAIRNNYDYLAIVNAINAEMGGMYDYTFPIVDNENFAAMSAALVKAPLLIRNAYLDTLRNVIANTLVKKVYRESNPFRWMYDDDTSLAGDGTTYVQEVAIDQFIPLAYNINSTPETFFREAPPKVKVQILTNVVRKVYEMTINEFIVQAAFESVNKFRSFFDTAMRRLYADMTEDDKEEIMAAYDAVINGGNMFLYPLAKPVDSQTALQFSTHLEKLSNDLGFKRRRQWNLNHLSTKSEVSEAVLIIAGDVIAVQNQYNLAWALNQSYLQLMEDGRLIKVDSDGLAGRKVYACYHDRDYTRFANIQNFPILKAWNNGESLTDKYWLHNWKRINFSYSSNAIAFCDPSVVSVGSVTLMPNATTVAPGKFLEFELPDVRPTADGMLFDAFVQYSATGDATGTDANANGFTDPTTTIDPWSGALYVGANETATTITVTGTHHLDSSVTGTAAITVG